MDIVNHRDTVPFTTVDGSTIRELLAHRNSGIRQQSLAEARLGVGAATVGKLNIHVGVPEVLR